MFSQNPEDKQIRAVLMMIGGAIFCAALALTAFLRLLGII